MMSLEHRIPPQVQFLVSQHTEKELLERIRFKQTLLRIIFSEQIDLLERDHEALYFLQLEIFDHMEALQIVLDKS